MAQIPWVHMTMEFDEPQRSDVLNSWICFTPYIEASQKVNGSIIYQHYDKEIMHIYEPKSNTITIYTTTDKYDLTKPKSPFEIISTILESMHKKNAKVSKQKAEQDGKAVEIISAVANAQEILMVRDTERDLLINMQMKTPQSDVGRKLIAKCTVEYPQKGPNDIYDLGAPRGAKIIDQRPKGELKDLIEKVQRRYDQGFGDYIAMVLSSLVDEDNNLEPFEITIMRKLGNLQRRDIYNASDCKKNAKSEKSLYEKVKNNWKDLTLEQVRKFENLDVMKQQVVFDGEYTTIRLRESKGKVTSKQHKGKVCFIGPYETVEWIAWVDFRFLTIGRTHHQKTLELLSAGGDHKGLIGLRVYEPEHKTRVCLGCENSKVVGPVVDNYWFDPLRDYLLMEHTREEVKGPNFTDGETKIVTLEVKQTKSGQWYPSHIWQKQRFIIPEKGDYKRTEDRRLILDIEPIFQKDIFHPDFSFLKK